MIDSDSQQVGVRLPRKTIQALQREVEVLRKQTGLRVTVSMIIRAAIDDRLHGGKSKKG